MFPNDIMYTQFNYKGVHRVQIGPRPTDGCAIQFLETYPDEYLEYWADIYVANNLKARGIMLETFLMFPTEILEMHLEAPLPVIEENLLPAQRAVQRRLDQDDTQALIVQDQENQLQRIPDLTCRNGRFVEPWHHTTWPRKAAKRVHG